MRKGESVRKEQKMRGTKVESEERDEREGIRERKMQRVNLREMRQREQGERESQVAGKITGGKQEKGRLLAALLPVSGLVSWRRRGNLGFLTLDSYDNTYDVLLEVIYVFEN